MKPRNRVIYGGLFFVWSVAFAVFDFSQYDTFHWTLGVLQCIFALWFLLYATGHADRWIRAHFIKMANRRLNKLKMDTAELIELLKCHQGKVQDDGSITCTCGFNTGAYHPATHFEMKEWCKHLDEVTPNWWEVSLADRPMVNIPDLKGNPDD